MLLYTTGLPALTSVEPCHYTSGWTVKTTVNRGFSIKLPSLPILSTDKVSPLCAFRKISMLKRLSWLEKLSKITPSALATVKHPPCFSMVSISFSGVASSTTIVNGMGIPESRFHDLRHSYAIASIQAGDDIKTVQENLGHHTAAFTLDTYGHVTDKMKQESAARMERFINGLESAKGKLKGKAWKKGHEKTL